METATNNWQECLDYFAPVTGQPPAGPDYEEFLRLRETASRIGKPCAVLLGREAFGGTVPLDVLQGLAQIVESFEQRVAVLHAKLPKGTASPAEKGAQ